jgi:hypothetical protein
VRQSLSVITSFPRIRAAETLAWLPCLSARLFCQKPKIAAAAATNAEKGNAANAENAEKVEDERGCRNSHKRGANPKKYRQRCEKIRQFAAFPAFSALTAFPWSRRNSHERGKHQEIPATL